MDVSKFDEIGKKRVAVAYLVAHMDEVPGDLTKLFTKLKGYETGVMNANGALKQAKQTIQTLQDQFKELLVSVNTVVELIADELPQDKVAEWCDKYEQPKDPVQAQPPVQAKVEPTIDMAGATAKTLPPLNLKPGK